jgi:hypothetical protein
VDRESSERAAAEPTPPPRPLTTPTIAVATGGDPAYLDLLAMPLEAAFALATPLGGPAGTADPSLGTVVLYRRGGEDMAQFVGSVAKIERVEPMTPDDEARLDPRLPDTAVVAVYGIDDTERLLQDPDICAPAGTVADEPLTFCVARADEARYSRFVVDGQALPVEPVAETGWWSWAAAAPDGGTILAEWTSYSHTKAKSGCRVPQSVLIPAGDGRPQPATTGAAVPLGWTTDGRAILFRPAGSGCSGADPGVYLATPDGEATLVEPTDREEPPPGLEPSIEPRPVEDVTP